MMRAGLSGLVVAAWLLSPSLVSGRAASLKVGDQAPAFALTGSDGRVYRLADYRGKQAVVLAWFAKAFTSG